MSTALASLASSISPSEVMVQLSVVVEVEPTVDAEVFRGGIEIEQPKQLTGAILVVECGVM